MAEAVRPSKVRRCSPPPSPALRDLPASRLKGSASEKPAMSPRPSGQDSSACREGGGGGSNRRILLRFTKMPYYAHIETMLSSRSATLISSYYSGRQTVPLVTGYLAGIYALRDAMAMIPLEPTAMTVMGTMALVAHNLIIEATAQDRIGTPWWWMLFVRLVSSRIAGLIVAWSQTALPSRHLPALCPNGTRSDGWAVPQ